MNQRFSLILPIKGALPMNWQRTQDIARAVGYEWRPGTGLGPVRDVLYAMELHGLAEHKERHNGHLWRKAR